MSWHVVMTEYRNENLAQDQIHELGLETFMPKMRRIKPSRYPLADPYLLIFPGYLFVHWDAVEHRMVWPAITRQRGVKTILGMGQDRRTVTPIRPEDFQRLQELATEMSAELELVNGRPKPLEVETMVRILWEPMKDATGKIEFDNGIRVDVLLAAAGVATKIRLPRNLIEAL